MKRLFFYLFLFTYFTRQWAGTAHLVYRSFTEPAQRMMFARANLKALEPYRPLYDRKHRRLPYK